MKNVYIIEVKSISGQIIGYKVGYTVDLPKRFTALQFMCGYRLRVLAVYQTEEAAELEKDIHAEYDRIPDMKLTFIDGFSEIHYPENLAGIIGLIHDRKVEVVPFSHTYHDAEYFERLHDSFMDKIARRVDEVENGKKEPEKKVKTTIVHEPVIRIIPKSTITEEEKQAKIKSFLNR